MHQSIPAVPIPPPRPWATVGGGGGGGMGQGWGICVPWVDPRAFDTWFQNRGVSRVFVMEAFIGQGVDYVADYLVHEGLEKLVDVFKGIFSRF